MPSVTSATSELDAALLAGCDEASFAAGRCTRTAVTPGFDFEHAGVRYQVKANRPSGRPRPRVALVAHAKPSCWDRLIWILYDRGCRNVEAWESNHDDYAAVFANVKRVSPDHMRRGWCLYPR